MFFCCCCPFNTLWFHSIQITQLSTVRGSEPWTITTRSLAVLPHSAYRLSLAFFFLLLADLNLGPLPRQPCLFPQMLMKKVVNLKIRLQKCVRILQSPLSAPPLSSPRISRQFGKIPKIGTVCGKDSRQRFGTPGNKEQRESPPSGVIRSHGNPVPPPLWQEVYTVRKLTPLLSSMWRNFTPFPSSRRKFTSHRVLQ